MSFASSPIPFPPLWQDMDNDAADISLVTMSEFGRTASQNGTGGTEQGQADVMSSSEDR